MSHSTVDRIPMDPGQRKLTGAVADIFEKPEIPGETPEQRKAREAQAETLASLNDEENRRLKRLLNAAQGLRAFRGSAMSRAAPGNRAGSASLFDAAGGRRLTWHRLVAAALGVVVVAAPAAAVDRPWQWSNTCHSYLNFPMA